MKQMLLTLVMAFSPVLASNAHDLMDIYRLALANDPEYRIADFNRQAAIEMKSQNLSEMLPDIGAHIASYRVRFEADKSFFWGAGAQQYWAHAFGIDIKQPVFNWSHWIQLEQADIKIGQIQAEQQAQYQTLIVRTVTAYFDTLAAHDRVEFSQAEKHAIERRLARIKARYQAGLAILPDVYEARASYDRAVADEISAQTRLDNAGEKLRELTGVNPQRLKPLLSEIPFQHPDMENIANGSAHAQEFNFSVLAQLNKTKLARKNIELQQSKHLPTIDLTAQFLIADTNHPFGFRGEYFGFGLQLNIPLFEGGATESRSRQAHYQYQTAKQDLITVKRRVNRELKDAYRSVIANIDKAKALQVTTQSAELALKAAETGLDSGLRTMLDVLREQRDLYKAQTEYAQSRYDYLISTIKFKEAMGTLNEQDVAQMNTYLTH